MPPSSDSHAGGALADTRSAALGRSPNSYVEILVSSVLIGGSSVLALVVGLVRTKAMAVLLGPAGFGLFAMFLAIADLARAAAGMGISSSGVRQIAAAVGSGDAERIALTAAVLRRVSVVLGLLGAVMLLILAAPVSTLTFGTADQRTAVALLGLAVFCYLVGDAQGALIQGMRRITDLAKMGVVSALFGAGVSIALVYALREQGVALAVVASAALGLAVSWWFARRVPVAPAHPARASVVGEAAALLKLGFAFMVSGMLMTGAAYTVRTIVLHSEGLEAAGLYSAAWTVGGLYVGIVMQAMAADFYPRLVGQAEDNPQCNRLVNEQTQVGLLLAGPGVIATLVFAPLVIFLVYSAEFAEAVGLLRWICLGVALRVITWPIGYIIVAKNRQAIFIGAEVAWTVVNVGLTVVCVQAFGLNGAGIAFFASYAFHGVMIYTIVQHMSGFRWSRENIRTGLLFLLSVMIVFCGFYALPPLWATVMGMLVMVVSSVHAIGVLVTLVSPNRIPQPVRRLLVVLFRFSI